MDRSWRTVALADPFLWTQLHIDVDKIARVSKSRVVETLKSILRLSEPQPLHVTLIFRNLDEPSWLLNLCNTIQGSSHRWASFNYQVPSGFSFESTMIPPLSFASGFASLEQLELHFGMWDGQSRKFNKWNLVESIQSAPSLRTVIIRDSIAPSGRFLAWPWAQITTLRFIRCRIHDSESFRDTLQQARALHTLDLDLSMQTNINPITLPSVRRFGVGTGEYCDLFTVPHLDHLEVALSMTRDDRLISRIFGMIQRSNVHLKGITVREVNLGDVTVERFLRAVGQEVKELILAGMVFDHLFDCIASEPHDFLPNLEILKIYGEDPTRASRERSGCWPHIPCELSPPLEAVVSAVQSRERLKTLELELLRGPSESSRGTSDDSTVRGKIEDLEGIGISVHTKHLDIPRELKGPALDRLGLVLKSKAGQFAHPEGGLHENMPVIDNLFRIVEKEVHEGRVTREDITG
ncbi:hypothetical protein V5O48_017795, partial [Marasmius crinis-equi]